MSLLEELSPIQILFTVIILFLILLIFFRVRLKFMFIQLVYGRYHFKYLRLFNRYFINRPYPDAIKDEPLDYVQSAFRSKPKIHIKTGEEITFAKYKVGEVYANFFKENGDPDYLTISDPHQKQPPFIVAGYKARVYDYEAMLVYFFVDSLLIMGQFRFRREKQPIELSDLIDKLSSRYKVDISSNTNKSFQLTDENGNSIHFRDNGFSVEINVINYNNELIRKIIEEEKYNGVFSGELSEQKQTVTF